MQNEMFTVTDMRDLLFDYLVKNSLSEVSDPKPLLAVVQDKTIGHIPDLDF
jgi:hypothetical protein